MRPPRLLEWMAARTLPDGLSRQGALGDLTEGYRRRARSSRSVAVLWYAWQVASLCAHAPGRAVRGGVGGGWRGDVRWAGRLLWRHPGFSLGVVAVLAAGIGAYSAVYSVVDGTFRGLSWWSDGDRAVAVWPERRFSFGMLDLYGQEQSAYETLGGYKERAVSMRAGSGEPASVTAVLITPALFRALAAGPRLGRALADDDGLVGADPVVVLGDGLWRRAFGADPDVLGRTVDIGGVPATVVGVQEPGRAPGGRAELWMPAVGDPRDDDFWRMQDLTAVGVLSRGVSIDEARRDLEAFADRLSTLFPMFYPPGFAEGRLSVVPADQDQRRTVATPLLLLLAGTSLLLVVAALNVGSLLLGRAIERAPELEVRRAIGAGRGRVVRQLLVEAGGFAIIGTTAAAALAALGAPFVARLFADEALVHAASVLDPSVFVPGSIVAFGAWAVVAAVPVGHFLRASRRAPGRAGRARAGAQRALIAAQGALATLLLVGAALLVDTVAHLRAVPLGFDPEGLVAVELAPPADRLENVGDARTLYDALSSRLAALPGVETVGLAGAIPLGDPLLTTPVNLEDAPVEPAAAVVASVHEVDPGFFQALGVQAREGRVLERSDRARAPEAVVVNESLARLLWPDGGAVGRRIAIDPHAWDRWVPVVGVVPDVRSGGITGPAEPTLYVALAEQPARALAALVRVSDRYDERTAGALRRAVAEVDPLVPVRAVRSMPGVVRSAYAVRWVVMGLLVGLAGFATVLGAVGVYATLTQHVAARRREMGVRIALGARPTAIRADIVRAGAGFTAVGILIGSIIALITAPMLESLLFGVSAASPAAYLGAGLVLIVTALAAAWVPAARAARLPPAEVLRSGG